MDVAVALTPAAAPFDSVSTQAWVRLLKACVASLLLHLALLVVIPVNPTGGLPQTVTTITARLEPAIADSEPQAESVALVAQPAPAPAPVAETAQKPSEPKPQVKPVPPPPQEPAASPSSGIELPFIRDPTYYPAKQLDVYPKPLAYIKSDFPESATRDKIKGGHVILLLLIDEFGLVNDVSVVSAEPEGYFEEAALKEFRVARFSPAERQGHAVKSRLLVRSVFVQ